MLNPASGSLLGVFDFHVSAAPPISRALKRNGLVLVAAGLGTKDNDFLAVGNTTQRHDMTP